MTASASGAACDLLDEIWVVFGALYLRDVLDVPALERDAIIAAFAAGCVAGSAALERLLHRVSANALLVATALACAVSFAGWLSATSITALGAGAFALGFFAAPMYPLTRAAAYRATAENSALVPALSHVFTPVSLALPLVLGWIADSFGLTVTMALLFVQPLVVVALPSGRPGADRRPLSAVDIDGPAASPQLHRRYAAMNRPNEHRTRTRRRAVAWQRYIRRRSSRLPLFAAVAAAGILCVVLLSRGEDRPDDDPWSGARALAHSEDPNRFQSLIVELNAPPAALAPETEESPRTAQERRAEVRQRVDQLFASPEDQRLPEGKLSGTLSHIIGSIGPSGATAALAGMGIRHDQAPGGLDAITDVAGTPDGCRPASAPIAPDAPGGPQAPSDASGAHASSNPSDPQAPSDSDDSTSGGPASVAGATPRDVAEPSSLAAHLVTAGAPYRRAADHPLSTFSVDVDTASYSTVRRHLLAGRLPPAEAVRVEELLNYFPYDDPHPSARHPVAIHGEVGRAPWAPSHQLVRLALTAREVETRARPAMNLVFLIDVSGSMSHSQKLPLLIESLRLLVGQLEARDRVGIVVYAGAAGVVLPSIRGDAHADILAALDRLHAGGPTHGGAGIELAYELASAERIAGGVNRVILATDGDFNMGVTDHDELVSLIRSRAQRGVYLTALGFGIGQGGDARLEALADRGDGSYAYIDSLREARKVLVEGLTGTLVTVAKDVKIQVAINPARVHAYRLIGYANRRLQSEDFEDDRKDAGDLGASQTVTALYEIVPQGIELSEALVERDCPPEATGSITGWGDELMRVDVRYQPPEGGASTLVRENVIDTARDFESASVDFRFAAAVALFGMGLSGAAVEPDALGWSLATAEAIASRSLGADLEGHRHELRDLVARARAAAAPSTARLGLGGDPAPL